MSSVVDLLDDQVQPGEKVLIVHLEEVWTCDGFAHSVLDDFDHFFYCTNTFMMLRQGGSELDFRELEVELGDNLDLRLHENFSRFHYI